MRKNTQPLESRLSRIESELAELKAALHKPNGVPWYRQIVGEFAGDKVYAEIVRLGRQIRRGKRKDC